MCLYVLNLKCKYSILHTLADYRNDFCPKANKSSTKLRAQTANVVIIWPNSILHMCSLDCTWVL
jgi:hypothetical protein